MIENEKSFDTGEVVLNYFVGPISGPPLLMLHGLSGRYQGLRLMIEPLMENWQVFACDFRGHGKSGRTPGHYGITDYGRDIATFLHQQFSGPVVLLGHSLGAITCLEIACQASERVRALVLLDPPLFLRNQSVQAWVLSGPLQLFSEVKKSSSSFDDIVATLRSMFPEDDEAGIQDLAMNLHQLDIETVVTALQDRLLAGWSLESVFPRITAPTLLVYGDWDHNGVVRDEDASYFQTNLPQAAVIKIPDASHFFPMEQTEITVGYIQNFLQSI